MLCAQGGVLRGSDALNTGNIRVRVRVRVRVSNNVCKRKERAPLRVG